MLRLAARHTIKNVAGEPFHLCLVVSLLAALFWLAHTAEEWALVWHHDLMPLLLHLDLGQCEEGAALLLVACRRARNGRQARLVRVAFSQFMNGNFFPLSEPFWYPTWLWIGPSDIGKVVLADLVNAPQHGWAYIGAYARMVGAGVVVLFHYDPLHPEQWRTVCPAWFELHTLGPKPLLLHASCFERWVEIRSKLGIADF